MSKETASLFECVPRFRLPRRVVYRDPEYTEMQVPDDAGARAFAKQLIRDGKAFTCAPNDDGWLVTVYEVNWPTRWEDH